MYVCSMRGNGASCRFANAAQNEREAGRDASRTSEARLRLHRLEKMVTDLMRTTKKESESSAHSANIDSRLKDLTVRSSLPPSERVSTGHLQTNGTETDYLGATHWATILDTVGSPDGRRCAPYS